VFRARKNPERLETQSLEPS